MALHFRWLSFLEALHGRCYGLTCVHVIGDGADYLFVASGRIPMRGMQAAAIEKTARAHAQDTDLQDVALIIFKDRIGPAFFGGTAYEITGETVGTGDTGHRLRVFGFLTERILMDADTKSITGGYCDLQFNNVGATSSDPCLRQALATYRDPPFHSLDGISGAPVYDETAKRLCGMVVRAGLNDKGAAIIWYVDMHHICQLLFRVHAGLS